MRLQGQTIQTTSQQGRKLGESLATKTLLRMLRSTLRSYPTAKLVTRKGGFGVSLAEGKSLYISSSGNWSPVEKRDLLALFATWLIADPEGLERASTPPGG